MAVLNQIELPNGTTYDIQDNSKVAKAGDTMTGTLIVPKTKIAHTCYGVSFGRTTSTPVETIIKTGIKWVSSAHMPVVHLTGYAYGLSSPVELKIGFYIYGGKVCLTGVVNMGSWEPDVYLYKYTRDSVDYVAVGLAGSCYFLQLQADVQDEMGKFANIVMDDANWSWEFYTDTGHIPTPDDGTTCLKSPYKANILNGIRNVSINGNYLRVNNNGTNTDLTIPYATSANQLTKSSTLDTVDKLNAFMGSSLEYASINGGIVTSSTDGLVLTIPWNTKYGQQIYFDDNSYIIKHRYCNNGTWSDWKGLIDESNINDYAPTKTGTGASGTWGISISGNADTATSATSATKATQDESGNNIKSTYANAISISDHTITLKNKNGTSLGTVTVPDNNTTYTVATGTANGKIKVTPSSGNAYEVSVYGLKSAAYKDVTDTYSATGADPVSGKAVAAAIDALPEPMVFKGSLGTGGTITTLPVDGTAKVGDTYKVITAGTYASKSAKVGDTFICLTKTSSANTWELIPSGDEPSGTVTSVAVANGGGLSVSGSPITSSGTITISHADTSSQASVNNSGRTYIQDITLDTYGHVTGITSATETVTNTDRYVNSAVFADATSADANNPVKMTLTRAGSDTASVTAYIPKVSSSSAGVVPKGAAVSSQSQSTKFLREDGTWATPSYTTDTNTHRPIQVNGSEILGNNTTALNLKAGTNVSLSNSSGTVTITSTDTKNTTGSTDTSSKIFLIGAASQAANPQTYSDNEVYATSGVLTTKSVQVGGGAVTLQYNSTTESLDFVFN